MKTPIAIAVALNAAILFANASSAQVPSSEKCFGVAKAGRNDCQTKHSSCAGTAKKDAQADAWLYVGKGTCEKIVGGSLAEPTKG
jgi:uncharacterized membrane protein